MVPGPVLTVENCFDRIKSHRRISTRYEKLATTFLAFVLFAAVLDWRVCDACLCQSLTGVISFGFDFSFFELQSGTDTSGLNVRLPFLS